MGKRLIIKNADFSESSIITEYLLFDGNPNNKTYLTDVSANTDQYFIFGENPTILTSNKFISNMEVNINDADTGNISFIYGILTLDNLNHPTIINTFNKSINAIPGNNIVNINLQIPANSSFYIKGIPFSYNNNFNGECMWYSGKETLQLSTFPIGIKVYCLS